MIGAFMSNEFKELLEIYKKKYQTIEKKSILNFLDGIYEINQVTISKEKDSQVWKNSINHPIDVFDFGPMGYSHDSQNLELLSSYLNIKLVNSQKIFLNPYILLQEKTFNNFTKSLKSNYSYAEFKKDVLDDFMDDLKIENDEENFIDEERLLCGKMIMHTIKELSLNKTIKTLLKDEIDHPFARIKKMLNLKSEIAVKNILDMYESNQVSAKENILYQWMLCDYAFNQNQEIDKREKIWEKIESLFDVSDIKKNYQVEFINSVQDYSNYIKFPFKNKDHVIDMVATLAEKSTILKINSKAPQLILQSKVAILFFEDDIMEQKNDYLFIIENYLPKLLNEKDCDFDGLRVLKDFRKISEDLNIEETQQKKGLKKI